MAYKLIWSPAAYGDLHDIVAFIARDSPDRAMSVGYRLISETDHLQSFPEFGRTVPEYENPNIREIISGLTGLSIELITRESFARLRAYGIPLAEFPSCNQKLALKPGSVFVGALFQLVGAQKNAVIVAVASPSFTNF